MLDKFHRAAESAAEGVSRRACLGRLGRGAMAVAGVMAGWLAPPAEAEAGGKCCCGYLSGIEQAYCYHPPKGVGCNQVAGEHMCLCRPWCT